MIAADISYLFFLTIGLFGAYQYRVNYVVASIILTLFWIAWNLFVICVYLNIGFLSRYDPYILNLNTGSKSWWFTNSISCSEKIENKLSNMKYQQEMEQIKSLLLSSTVASSTSSISETSSISNSSNTNILEELIQTSCLVPFYTIEIAQSAILIILGILCVIFGLLLANAFNEDDDTFDYIGGFDSINIMSNIDQPTLPRNNHHIRLEPLYATNY